MNLVDLVLEVHRQLDADDVPHAFGGALALAYISEPRGTVDIDINVFTPFADIDPVLDAFVASSDGNHRHSAHLRCQRSQIVGVTGEDADLAAESACGHGDDGVGRVGTACAAKEFTGRPAELRRHSFLIDAFQQRVEPGVTRTASERLSQRDRADVNADTNALGEGQFRSHSCIASRGRAQTLRVQQ